ncbi:MAG: hypothetical protein A2284_09755 [Deltaproteobacteria bacterium RIFOXYA12_FULL_61_11]|nr:MAG: hypothetical protein A2284_09755 [Deltaproteobacteria bacterium RIFOXYA12_FULL_61_11]
MLLIPRFPSCRFCRKVARVQGMGTLLPRVVAVELPVPVQLTIPSPTAAVKVHLLRTDHALEPRVGHSSTNAPAPVLRSTDL